MRRMGQRALLLEAHHTTHIEGTQLSIEQAQQLWDGKDVPGADIDDVRELLNCRGAFELVGEYLTSGAPITEGLIREIHQRLVAGVRGGQAKPGEWRMIQNFVANSRTGAVVYTPPPPSDVPPGLMHELVEWVRSESAIHPVLVAGIAQFQLVHIHPFVEGNGRTSRPLSTLCLCRPPDPPAGGQGAWRAGHPRGPGRARAQAQRAPGAARGRLHARQAADPGGLRAGAARDQPTQAAAGPARAG